jgi:hypothetical protein
MRWWRRWRWRWMLGGQHGSGGWGAGGGGPEAVAAAVERLERAADLRWAASGLLTLSARPGREGQEGKTEQAAAAAAEGEEEGAKAHQRGRQRDGQRPAEVRLSTAGGGLLCRTRLVGQTAARHRDRAEKCRAVAAAIVQNRRRKAVYDREG